MDEWAPLSVMPNLDMQGALECELAAIVSPTDPRVERIRKAHPTFTTFISKFSGQFREQVWPSVLILRTSAAPSYRSAEAASAFRDILSLSVVPFARARRLLYRRTSGLAFSNIFQFYPWMLDKNYKDMIIINPGQIHGHFLSQFRAQTFPEILQASLFLPEIDAPLARELLQRWVFRFNSDEPSWENRALFRSLNMANEAARLPASTAATFYDIGRSLALWVSALEILVHPGKGAKAGFRVVSNMLEQVAWVEQETAQRSHDVKFWKDKVCVTEKRTLASHLCQRVYRLRNDFLHGNDVEAEALDFNKMPAIDYAACIYRLALTAFLDLQFRDPAPAPEAGVNGRVAHFARKREFREFQERFEKALLTSLAVQPSHP